MDVVAATRGVGTRRAERRHRRTHVPLTARAASCTTSRGDAPSRGAGPSCCSPWAWPRWPPSGSKPSSVSTSTGVSRPPRPLPCGCGGAFLAAGALVVLLVAAGFCASLTGAAQEQPGVASRRGGCGTRGGGVLWWRARQHQPSHARTRLIGRCGAAVLFAVESAFLLGSRGAVLVRELDLLHARTLPSRRCRNGGLVAGGVRVVPCAGAT